MDTVSDNVKISESTIVADDRFDRQERTIGREAMRQLFHTRILLVGLGGLGVEIGRFHSFIYLYFFVLSVH